MLHIATAVAEALLLLPVAIVVSWLARAAIRALTRGAVRRAQERRGFWRVRLDRRFDHGLSDDRKRQRADAVARMLGHAVTAAIFALAALAALAVLGVDPVYAISSAGFLGFAIALSGQDLVKDYLDGTRVLLEDRYAVGDDVVVRIGGEDVRGTVDLVGTASVRLRTLDGATWHAGHHSIESVTNLSQVPAVSDIEVPVDDWAATDEAAAAERLAGSSNDVGLTGLVFMRDIETHGANDERDDHGHDGTVTVRVKANRTLSTPEADLVRTKLLDS